MFVFDYVGRSVLAWLYHTEASKIRVISFIGERKGDEHFCKQYEDAPQTKPRRMTDQQWRQKDEKPMRERKTRAGRQIDKQTNRQTGTCSKNI